MNSILEKACVLDLIWDLQKADSALYDVVLQSYPEIFKAFEILQKQCPVASTCEEFVEGRFFRLKGHARSFCMTVGDGVLVFKGSEPFSKDYLSVYERSWIHPTDDMPSTIEGFVMFEHEVYLAMTRKAALNCAEVTKQFVKDYHTQINLLPHVPIPLHVFMIPDSITKCFLDTVSPFLSNRSQFSVHDYTMTLAKDGLAVYVYYYAGHPLRAAHAMGDFPGGYDIWRQERDLKNGEQFDLKAISNSWISLVANMFGVGYVPTTWLHTGNCVHPQNLVMDGGMCDIDSIEPLTNLNSDRDVARSILVSITTLAKSISALRSVDVQVAFTSVWYELSKQIRLNPYKLTYDTRFLRLFNGNDLDIITELSNMLSSTSSILKSE